jgi:hypothetical protein
LFIVGDAACILGTVAVIEGDVGVLGVDGAAAFALDT